MEHEVLLQYLQMCLGNPGAITVFKFILDEYPEKCIMIFEKMNKRSAAFI